MILRMFVAAIAALFLSVPAAFAADSHKLVIQVDENDPAVMNLALNNAENVKAHFEGIGEEVKIEIVAYGPGLKMYTADSPVKDRLAAMSLQHEDMQFSACGNTHKKMSAKAGKDVVLLSEAVVVPAGVVRIMELQNEGYNYIRP